MMVSDTVIQESSAMKNIWCFVSTTSNRDRNYAFVRVHQFAQYGFPTLFSMREVVWSDSCATNLPRASIIASVTVSAKNGSHPPVSQRSCRTPGSSTWHPASNSFRPGYLSHCFRPPSMRCDITPSSNRVLPMELGLVRCARCERRPRPSRSNTCQRPRCSAN